MLGNEVENSTTKTDYVGAVLNFVSNNIDNIKIEANTSFQLDFTYNTKTENPTSFSVNFNPEDLNNVISITIKDMTYNGCSGDITFAILKEFNSSNTTSFATKNNIGYVDLTTLPLLTKIGIATTNRRDYEMSGNLIFKTSGIASLLLSANINASVNIYLKVGDTVDENNLFTIDGLIEITLPESINENKPAFGTSATLDKDNYTTRFFIKDTNAYVNKTHFNSHQTASRKTIFNSWSEWSAPVYTKDETYLKLTQEQIVNDMMYYIFDFSLNAGETLKEIEKFVNLGKDTDPLDFFKSFELKNDGTNDYYQCYLNIKSLIKVYADLYYYHGENDYKYLLERLHVHSNFDIVIGKINIDLDVTNNPYITDTYYEKMVSSDNYTCVYDQFLIDWNNDSQRANMEFRYSKDLFDYPYYLTVTTTY